jgi:hypothetical protein
MVYPAKRDWWVYLPVGLIGVGLPCLGVAFLVLGATGQLPPLVAGLLATEMLALGGFLDWVFLATSYAITPDDLRVRFGPFRWAVPLDRLEGVVCKRGMSPELAWGLAWSLDRVLVRYRKANGRPALLALALSPRDKAGFVDELATAVPGLPVTGREARDELPSNGGASDGAAG